MDELPPLNIIVEDALALGYEVVVLVVDPENQNKLWCANTMQWNEDITVEKIKSKSWTEAMEKIHGGKISSMEEIEIEEAFYSGKIETGISEFDRPHETWFNPGDPDAVVDEDSACYCGWLGIDPPTAEFAPPGCSCVVGENIDPNHGHDLGYITFIERQQKVEDFRDTISYSGATDQEERDSE